MPESNGFYTAAGIVVVAVIVVYELYKRANKQGTELRDSKKREKRGKARRKN